MPGETYGKNLEIHEVFTVPFPPEKRLFTTQEAAEYTGRSARTLQHAGVLTPLIADCAGLLAEHLEQVAIVEIEWDEYPHDIVRDALLVFRRTA
jgi:hypothetical protein